MDSNWTMIRLALMLRPLLDSHETTTTAASAREYAKNNEGVRYEWWTEKTGPGTARVAWRLIKETA